MENTTTMTVRTISRDGSRGRERALALVLADGVSACGDLLRVAGATASALGMPEGATMTPAAALALGITRDAADRWPALTRVGRPYPLAY